MIFVMSARHTHYNTIMLYLYQPTTGTGNIEADIDRIVRHTVRTTRTTNTVTRSTSRQVMDNSMIQWVVLCEQRTVRDDDCSGVKTRVRLMCVARTVTINFGFEEFHRDWCDRATWFFHTCLNRGRIRQQEREGRQSTWTNFWLGKLNPLCFR